MSTATPTQFVLKAPATHRINIGDFQANAVFPGPRGLVLYGNPGSTPQRLGPEGADGVYFYDFSSRQTETLATATAAPDGTPRGVQNAQPAGDWVVYLLADTNSAHWGLWAINVVTHEQRLIDSYIAEQSAPIASWYGGFASNGMNLVWSASIQTSGPLTFVLKDYNFATQVTKVLMSGPDTPSIAPRGMSTDGTVLLNVRHRTAGQTDGVYLWTLGQSAPQQISSEDALNGHISAQYAVWDNVRAKSLTLYDRTSGKLVTNWVQPCIRPDIGQDRPYVVCLDFDRGILNMVRAPSGQAVDIGNASGAETGAIANGRDYWVEASASTYNDVVDYIDLPTS